MNSALSSSRAPLEQKHELLNKQIAKKYAKFSHNQHMAESTYTFTEDWFSHNVPILKDVLADFAGKENVKMLEIGSFQGRSTVWMLENILTHETSTITCIDTFEGSVEHTNDQCKDLWEMFSHNTAPFGDKVVVQKGSSHVKLREMANTPTYDIIYVDGDHSAPSVLQDAVLSFPLLKPGGVLVFDDYLWQGQPDILDRPKIAVDAFIHIFQQKLQILATAWQFIVKKK
jgi:predicted O-methyltransferase YrrM